MEENIQSVPEQLLCARHCAECSEPEGRETHSCTQKAQNLEDGGWAEVNTQDSVSVWEW